MSQTPKKTASPLSDCLKQTFRTHLWLVILMAAMIVVYVVLSLFPPMLLGVIVDHLTALDYAEAPSRYLSLALGYFGLLFAAGIAGAAKDSLITVFGQKVTHAIRSSMTGKLTHLPSSYFVEHTSGEITSLLVNDVNTIESLFTSGVISMVSDLAETVGILAVVFFRSVGIGLLLLITLPLVFLFTRRVQKGTLKAQTDKRRAVARASSLIPETLRNLRTIHVFRSEGLMEERYGRAIDNDFAAMEKSNFYGAVYSPVILCVSALLTSLMMAGAGYAFSESGNPVLSALFTGMTVGTAVADISYISRIFTPIENIGMEIQNIQSASAGVRRIREFLSLPEEEPIGEESAKKENAPEDSASKADGAAAIEISHLSFGYTKDEPVLNDISLSAAPGETITLVGRTGAGKSTLLKLVLGLYRPQRGTVRLFGRNACSIPAEERRSTYGYVSQSFYRVPGSVADQVTLKDPSISRDQVEKAIQLAGLSQAVSHLDKGLDTPCETDTFSEGQFQLLSIARAVVKDSRILLLDEITAKLDAATEHELMTALNNASRGRTVLSVSHRTEAMGGGRIVYLGSPSSE